MHRLAACTLFVFAFFLPTIASAGISMGMMESNPGGMIDFNSSIGSINPEFNVGGTTVSFGSTFVGQVLGSMNNELIDSSPSSPLQLDPNGPDVSVLFEITAGDFVLGGADGNSFLTTPLAIFFADPVKDVYFDLGHLDGPGTVMIEAYDADGQILGTFGNSEGGWQTIEISDASRNSISGISIFVPEHGMDWEGFAIDNLGFGFSTDDGGGPGGDPDDPGVIPEPSTIFIWCGLGMLGVVGSWLNRRAASK